MYRFLFVAARSGTAFALLLLAFVLESWVSYFLMGVVLGWVAVTLRRALAGAAKVRAAQCVVCGSRQDTRPIFEKLKRQPWWDLRPPQELRVEYICMEHFLTWARLKVYSARSPFE